jgi:hypothetical protein
MLWECRDCGSRPAVGVMPCPECGGSNVGPEEKDMPKISREQGPTYNDPETGEPIDLAPGSEVRLDDGTTRPTVAADFAEDAPTRARGTDPDSQAASGPVSGRASTAAERADRQETDRDDQRGTDRGTKRTADTAAADVDEREGDGAWPGKSSEQSLKSDTTKSKPSSAGKQTPSSTSKTANRSS